MQGGAIPGMTLQPIAWIALRQGGDQGVPGLLGQHAGGRNRQAVAIASHHGALVAVPTPQGQHPIHQQQLKRTRQFLQGAGHGQLCC